MRKILFVSWTVISTVGFIGLGVVYLNKTNFQTLYMGLDNSTSKEIDSLLHKERISFEISYDNSEIKVPSNKVKELRNSLKKHIRCSSI